jgi:hypothetical protein
MTVRANKPAFNIREKLKELTHSIGLKGRELMRAATVQEARDLVSAGRKNLVINGEFAVSQRGTTFTYSGTNQDHTVYNSDRFTTQTFGSSFPSGDYLQITQSSDVPTISQAGTRFKNSQKIEVLQDISFGSGPNAVWTKHVVEGQNSANLGLGTSEASDFTVSFWVKSTKTGTITVNLKSSDSNLSYTTAANISSADSWQKIVKTIPGPTSGTFNTDTTAGLQLIITWSIDSGWIATSTLDTWNSGNFSGSTTQSKMLLADGDIIYLTGVQIEKGKNATDFEHRNYGEELALCQRYYQRLSLVNYAGFPLIVRKSGGNAAGEGAYRLSPPMRTTPSGGFFGNGVINGWYIYTPANNTSSSVTSITLAQQNLSDYITDTGSADYVQFQLAGMSGGTGDVGIVFFTGGSQNNQYYFSSEL